MKDNKQSQMVYKHRVSGVKIVVTKPYPCLYVQKHADGSTTSFTQAELVRDYSYQKKESKLQRFGGVLDTSRDLRNLNEMRELAKRSYERHI